MGSWAKVNFGQKSKLFSFLRFVQYRLKFLRFGIEHVIVDQKK